jgi:excisionase family DNA binding protein
MPRIKYFTRKEVAEMFGVNEVTVSKWIHSEELRAVKIVDGPGARKEYRISEADLIRFEEQRSTKAAS